jgi:choline dehydrogenase-like flavoprotein
VGFVGSDEVTDGSVVQTDVCVIGAGAAGLTVARELDRRGLDTVLLEAGGTHRDVRTEADTFELDVIGEPQRNPIESRGRWFGGSTNLWFGRIAMPTEIDFEHRPWVPHSGWPVRLGELSRWVDVAIRILDVRHADKLAVDAWETTPTIETFRGPDTDIEVFLWSSAMDMGRHARPLLAASRTVRVVTDATATELVIGDDGLVRSVSVRRADGGTFSVVPRRVVLAAGGIENPRLLLASPGRTGRGVGNEHDNVGRYYLDHPRGEGLAHVDLRGLDADRIARIAGLDERADSPFGHVQFRMVFDADTQRREHLLNHALHGHLVTDAHGGDGFAAYKRLRERARQRSLRAPAGLGRDLVAVGRSAPQLMSLAADRLRKQRRFTRFVVVDQLEQEPDRDSRITLDPHRRDAYGLPRVRLDWRIGASTRHSHRRMHELFRDRLAGVGIRSLHSALLDGDTADLELWDMKHPSGTTRMSASPADGVVDADCRVHGVPNLYVAGSSVFPTSGHFNPTLIIVALAARLADHLAGP